MRITRTFASPKDITTPFSQTVKSANDGSFRLEGLAPGTYSFCAEVPGDGYLSGCHWGGPLLGMKVSAGQIAKAIIRVQKGSILKVRVLDPGKAAAALAAQQPNGKNSPSPVPNLPIHMGVQDAHGHFIPVHTTGSDGAGVNYQLTIPFNTPLTFQIISAKLRLADDKGSDLPTTPAGSGGPAAQSSQTSFQHGNGDPNPKSFQFTIKGVNP